MSALELLRPADPVRAATQVEWARQRGIELRYVDESDGAELARWQVRNAEYPRPCPKGVHTISGPEDVQLQRRDRGYMRQVCAQCERERVRDRKRREREARRAAA